MGTANITFGKVGNGGSPDLSSTVFLPEQYENLTTTNASATSSVNSANTTGNKFTNAVRVVLSQEGYVNIGGTAAVGTGMRCLADTEYYFSVKAGQGVSIIDTA